MLYSEKIKNQELLTELSVEASANIKGGQEAQNGQTGENGETSQTTFNQTKYLQALGLAYLAPPGTNEITDKEALFAQYQGWKK
ncbi:hypothetical protein [Trichormus variabilis]|uniref:Uncharacterized protein n=1 Tax=Trichormus variabilis SAG 1403-4b TaxID=447716 RepID=A0A3S1ADF7_ANAVA|nr:hypothetical protein [Trichormus variabilis]MBD2625412.1 hypothetical protein [Trichormus variabilis FACHB-164]RUS98696.1 hypothetical protein DSM107003_07150 [Trichormus variabilis SAG 1403-4b]